MTNFSMSAGGPAARVTAMSSTLSRDEAWTLFCEWTESESLRRHVLAVEAAMRAYARRFGEAVDRDALREGAADLGVDFDEHLAFVIAAMEDHAEELGL